jgi:hypothetical protein
MRANGIMTANGHPATFPGTKLVQDIRKQAKDSHVRTLKRLANLSVPVVGASVQRDTLNDTIDEFRAHGATTTLFGELFALFQRGELSREELDQRLINWGMTMPGLREKFDELPKNVRECVEEFRRVDLKKEWKVKGAEGFKLPMNLATVRKSKALKEAWEGHVSAGQSGKYTTVVENSGEPVAYVDKFPFENWGETSRGTPAVHPQNS